MKSLLLVAGMLLAVSVGRAQTYTFTTLAGNAGYGTADGFGSAARFSSPMGIAVDRQNNLYVADTGNQAIRKISPNAMVTTLAGLPGTSGDTDGTGSGARFNLPAGIAVDGSNNVYVADTGNHTIRKIAPDGKVSTLAGLAGSAGSTNGIGNAARFNLPTAVVVDGAGNVYVTDNGNYTVRKITLDGVVTTLAGLAGNPGSTNGIGSEARFNDMNGIAVDRFENVYVTDAAPFGLGFGGSVIRKITPEGVVTTPSGLYAGGPGSINIHPENGANTGEIAWAHINGVAVDHSGSFYATDSTADTVGKVTTNGTATTIGQAGYLGSADGAGNAARFRNPSGIAVDDAGNAYVADTGNHTIRKITPDGTVTTLAGSPGGRGFVNAVGGAARFNTPTSVAVDRFGNIYVADSANNNIRKIAPDGTVSTLTNLSVTYLVLDCLGCSPTVYAPKGVAVDSSGNVYEADNLDDRIQKMLPDGTVATLAGVEGRSGSTDGSINVARFNIPTGIAADSFGNVFVADTGNHTVRKITREGVVSTVAGLAGSSGSADGTGNAARFNAPGGVAVDGSGNLYVADTGNHVIRKINPGGVVTTLAGTAGSLGSTDGPAEVARFNGPGGIAVDNAGTVYVADSGNDTIRKITPEGVVTTLAGLAGSVGSTDGIGGAVRFNNPGGIAVDSSGNLYVADMFNNTVRVGHPDFLAARPTLQITSLGDRVILQWPLVTPTYTLEFSSELPTAQWTSIASALVNGQNVVTNTVANRAGFYRLRTP